MERWIDDDREDCVVRDDAGLAHASVLCERNAPHEYLVTMCEMFDCIEVAFAAGDPQAFKTPERRWPKDHEEQGMVTCLRCIGAK